MVILGGATVSYKRGTSVNPHPYTLTFPPYRGTSLIINSAPLEPYSRTMHKFLWWFYGEGAVFCVRGTPVNAYPSTSDPHPYMGTSLITNSALLGT